MKIEGTENMQIELSFQNDLLLGVKYPENGSEKARMSFWLYSESLRLRIMFDDHLLPRAVRDSEGYCK